MGCGSLVMIRAIVVASMAATGLSTGRFGHSLYPPSLAKAVRNQLQPCTTLKWAHFTVASFPCLGWQEWPPHLAKALDFLVKVSWAGGTGSF